jgi:tetratricopeptide (TPR) repeat protein
MMNRCAILIKVRIVLAGMVLLGVGFVRAQEIPDRKALQLEFDKVDRLSKEGKFTEALPIARRLLAATEKLLGAEAVETADCLIQLGKVSQDLGQFAQAEPLYRRGLQIRETQLGKDHPGVANSLNYLALLYRDMGQYTKAEPLFQRSLHIFEAKYGKEHLNVATSLNNLAMLYQSMSQYAKAEPLYQRSLQIREAKLGQDHLEVAQSLQNLASLYFSMGQYARAEPLFQRSLHIFEAKLGKDHLFIGICLNNLAGLYKAMGQYAKAEPLYQRNLQIGEAKLGKDHPQVALSLNNLAALYAAMRQNARAEPLLQRSLQIREAKLPKDHPDIAVSLNNLAMVYENQEKYEQAEPLLQRSLQISESQLGKNHPAVAVRLNNLGALYYDLGQYAKAEPLYQRCLQIRTAQLGPDHPEVGFSFHNLGTLYEALAQPGQAADFFDRARRLSRRHALRVLTVLSEPEQINFLRNTDDLHWHIALALGLRHPNDSKLAELSAAWLVNGKGLAQQTLAQAALLARDSNDPTLRDLSRTLQQTRQELAQLTLQSSGEQQLAQRQRRLKELSDQEQALAKQLHQAAGTDSDESWVELDRLRQALPPGAVLIELARFPVFDFKAAKEQKRWQPARYAAWVIPAAGPVRVLDLGPADAIDAAVQQVRQALQDATKTIRLKGEADAETALREPLEALAKKVLHPLVPHIGKNKRWVLSPDGSLWLTPWAALPLPDGKYAVEGHILSYAISGRELLDDAAAKVKETAPLVLADPDFDLGLDQVALATRRLVRERETPPETRGLSKALPLGSIKRLPGTASEAEAIAAKLHQYASAAPRVLMDKDATAGVFQATRNPKVVVLSTHGYFLPDQELDSKEMERLDRLDSSPRGLRLENPLLRCGLLLDSYL